MPAAWLRFLTVLLATLALVGVGAPCAAAQTPPPPDPCQAMAAAPAHHDHAPTGGAPTIYCTYACALIAPSTGPSAPPVRVSYPPKFSSVTTPLLGLEPLPETPPPR